MMQCIVVADTACGLVGTACVLRSEMLMLLARAQLLLTCMETSLPEAGSLQLMRQHLTKQCGPKRVATVCMYVRSDKRHSSDGRARSGQS